MFAQDRTIPAFLANCAGYRASTDWTRPLRHTLALVVLTLALAGCGGDQNALDPKSAAQHAIVHLWWWVLIGCSIGFAIVCLLLFLGWLRRNRTELPFGGGEREGTVLVIGLGIVLPLILLSGLFFWSDIVVIRSTAAPTAGSTRLTLDVIGHQWWWEVRYPGTKAVTANEIHIPVDVPVDVVGTTDDVIHSFWIPELNRKIDLIPGRRNRVLLEANVPGTYKGQCAEFCGLQHAHMTATVIAQPRAEFNAWLENMAKPARAPTTPSERAGRTAFVAESCASCHRIRGTAANGNVGPDLTHLETRRMLAAGTIVNDESHLAGWIAAPQHFKPGNRMPTVQLTGTQFSDVLAYLRSLK
jgi:cytochrome c oxidase subunit II